MPRERDTGTALGVRAAIAKWAGKRQEMTKKGELPPAHPEHAEELQRLLEENKAYIYGELVRLIPANNYSNRLWLSDVSPELKQFFNRSGVYADREMLDTLRGWFSSFFDDIIRVEGDGNAAGLYLDISYPSEQHQGRDESEHGPYTDKELRAMPDDMSA